MALSHFSIVLVTCTQRKNIVIIEKYTKQCMVKRSGDYDRGPPTIVQYIRIKCPEPTANSNIQYETNNDSTNANTRFSSFDLFCKNYLVHGYVTKSEGPQNLESQHF